MRVHITDAEKQRWEVPYNLLPRQPAPVLKQTIGGSRKNPITVSELSGSELIFSYVTDPFGFAVKRKSTGQILFNSSSDGSDPFGEMVFKDQYLEISTKLPKDASLYGLGENTQPHGIKLYPNEPYTLYTMDISAINPNTDLYGSHPVYMDLRNVGGQAYAHAVLLLNSNGMDVFYRGNSLTYKIIGGVFDFYFFSGPTPLGVVDQYTQFIGRPAPMPYWSFGNASRHSVFIPCISLSLTHSVLPLLLCFSFSLNLLGLTLPWSAFIFTAFACHFHWISLFLRPSSLLGFYCQLNFVWYSTTHLFMLVVLVVIGGKFNFIRTRDLIITVIIW